MDPYQPFKREPKRSTKNARGTRGRLSREGTPSSLVVGGARFIRYSLTGVVDDLWYRLQINYGHNRREEIVRTRVQNNILYAFVQNRAISQSNSKSVDAFRRKR